MLDESLKKVSISLDKTIFIDVDYEILKDRILARINETNFEERRSDDNVDTLIKRIEVYKSNTLPIVEYYKKRYSEGGKWDVFNRGCKSTNIKYN